MTGYIGIDYSGGTVNRDAETGIHYGIISQLSLNPEALDDIQRGGDDLDFEDFKEELKGKLEVAINRVLDEAGLRDDQASNYVDDIIDDIIDDLEFDGYEGTGDCTRYKYSDEKEDLIARTTSDGEVFVIKSKFYTHCQFCSPCVPGAGNLDVPVAGGPKTYCFGPDWFDKENPCPYPIYEVATGELVYSPKG